MAWPSQGVVLLEKLHCPVRRQIIRVLGSERRCQALPRSPQDGGGCSLRHVGYNLAFPRAEEGKPCAPQCLQARAQGRERQTSLEALGGPQPWLLENRESRERWGRGSGSEGHVRVYASYALGPENTALTVPAPVQWLGPGPSICFECQDLTVTMSQNSILLSDRCVGSPLEIVPFPIMGSQFWAGSG